MTKYYADGYLRLSDEDGDKLESNSIVNQRYLINEYMKSVPDIQFHTFRVDDGYSGGDFCRPALKSMIDDIKAGLVNCVIVKDLSRFGRNYIECGKYLQRLFPSLGVRFISITENIDTLIDKPDDIMISFRNLVNDAYIGDISVKVRSNLESKRKRGEYISPFVPYGYMRNGKNTIVIDEDVESVVKDIFNWKLEGMSNEGIANLLNSTGILSPMEYKRFSGSGFKTSFKTSDFAKWSAVAVDRILKNEIYIGTLVQGKRTTVNHRVKNTILKPESEWIKIENAHTPIISKEIFERVKTLLERDTRIGIKENKVHLFSGLLFCADCGQNMVRKETTGKNGKKYYYYVCSTHRKEKRCSPHSISEKNIHDTVQITLQRYIEIIVDFRKMLEYLSTLPRDSGAIKTTKRIELLQAELKETINFKMSVYEDFNKDLISKEDFDYFSKTYTQKCNEIQLAIEKQKEILANLQSNNQQLDGWMKQALQYGNATNLSRKMLVMLIDNILICSSKEIEILFHYQDEFKCVVSFMDELKEAANKGE